LYFCAVKPCPTIATSPLHEVAATRLEENKSASSHIREDTAETDHSILSNEDGITQGKYQHTQGKNQLDIAAHLAVISAAQGKQNAQHGNNQMPAIQHMPYSSIHNRKDLL
jgi:hypothetical protein